MERNWTTENVFKSIIFFAFPFFISTLLQTLYGIADLFIIGQFNSTDSITAVSIGSQVMHMLTVSIVGLSTGSTITIGKAIGAKDREKAHTAIGNSITLFMSASLILTVCLLLLVNPVISLLSTPEQAVAGASVYLKICFLGIPFITAYNLISSVFRGLGDSKTPMYFIATAFVCNILLDYLFIGYFHMGPAGAALGTTLAQAFSVFTALFVILRKSTGIKVKKQHCRLQSGIVRTILRIGLPIFFQNSFIQVAFLAVTVFVNMRGLYDAAAVGIVEKIIGIMFLIPSSMLSTVSALAAQNMGAGKYKRARQTLWYSMGICVGFGITVSILTIFMAPDLMRLFESNKTVILRGTQYIKGYVWDCIFAGIHFCFSGYFSAMERSELSFIHNFLSILIIRIPCSYLAAKFFPDTLFPLGLVTTTASLFSVIFCAVTYHILRKKEQKFS